MEPCSRAVVPGEGGHLLPALELPPVWNPNGSTSTAKQEQVDAATVSALRDRFMPLPGMIPESDSLYGELPLFILCVVKALSHLDPSPGASKLVNELSRLGTLSDDSFNKELAHSVLENYSAPFREPVIEKWSSDCGNASFATRTESYQRFYVVMRSTVTEKLAPLQKAFGASGNCKPEIEWLYKGASRLIIMNAAVSREPSKLLSDWSSQAYGVALSIASGRVEHLQWESEEDAQKKLTRLAYCLIAERSVVGQASFDRPPKELSHYAQCLVQSTFEYSDANGAIEGLSQGYPKLKARLIDLIQKSCCVPNELSRDNVRSYIVHLLHSKKGPTVKVRERFVSYWTELTARIPEVGPLEDVLCKTPLRFYERLALALLIEEKEHNPEISLLTAVKQSPKYGPKSKPLPKKRSLVPLFD
jgi:hypothetical protein